jgi:DNA repair protein RecN (Recombination protein N)
VRALLDAYAGVDGTPLLAAWHAWQQAQAALDARSAQDSLAQRTRAPAVADRRAGQAGAARGRMGRAEPAARACRTRRPDRRRLAASRALESDEDDGGALPALAQAQEALQASAAIEPEFSALLEPCRPPNRSCATPRAACTPICAAPTSTPSSWPRWTSASASGCAGAPPPSASRAARPAGELARRAGSPGAAGDLEQLQAQLDQTRSAYDRLAGQVGRARAQAAPRLSAAVTAAMQELGMAGGASRCS